MFGDDDHPHHIGFDLTPEMEELLVECSRISLASLLDGPASDPVEGDFVA